MGFSDIFPADFQGGIRYLGSYAHRQVPSDIHRRWSEALKQDPALASSDEEVHKDLVRSTLDATLSFRNGAEEVERVINFIHSRDPEAAVALENYLKALIQEALQTRFGRFGKLTSAVEGRVGDLLTEGDPKTEPLG